MEWELTKVPELRKDKHKKQFWYHNCLENQHFLHKFTRLYFSSKHLEFKRDFHNCWVNFSVLQTMKKQLNDSKLILCFRCYFFRKRWIHWLQRLSTSFKYFFLMWSIGGSFRSCSLWFTNWINEILCLETIYSIATLWKKWDRSMTVRTPW